MFIPIKVRRETVATEAFCKELKDVFNPDEVKSTITLMGYVVMEMEEKTYSYPVNNFKFNDNFNLNNV